MHSNLRLALKNFAAANANLETMRQSAGPTAVFVRHDVELSAMNVNLVLYRHFTGRSQY